MKLDEILLWLEKNSYSFSFTGDRSIEIDNFSSLKNYKNQSLTWIKNQENYDRYNTGRNILCAIVEDGIKTSIKNIIVAKNSKAIFFDVLHEFWGDEISRGFVGQGTVISPNADVDKTVSIGYNCSIVGEVHVGANTVIENNVVIQGRVHIGNNCYIQSGTVIGVSGFGYTKDPDLGTRTMVDHFGGVVIEDNVFIGAHTNIARGTIDDTVISRGVKIAPSTHIGHNNYVGEDVVIICSKLFGSVSTGDDSYIVDSTIKNQSEIGNHTVVGMGSVVTKNLPDDVVAFGIPAKPVRKNDTNL